MYEADAKRAKLREQELIHHLRDQLDIAKISFIWKPEFERGEATIKGRTIQVEIDEPYMAGFSRYTNPDTLKYKIFDARVSSGSWRGLNSRYVKQTKRGREGDAIRCVEVMKEAAQVQIAQALEKNRLAENDLRLEELEEKRDERFAPFTGDGLLDYGVKIEKRRNKGFTVTVVDDDFDLLKKLYRTIRGQ